MSTGRSDPEPLFQAIKHYEGKECQTTLRKPSKWSKAMPMTFDIHKVAKINSELPVLNLREKSE